MRQFHCRGHYPAYARKMFEKKGVSYSDGAGGRFRFGGGNSRLWTKMMTEQEPEKEAVKNLLNGTKR